MLSILFIDYRVIMYSQQVKKRYAKHLRKHQTRGERSLIWLYLIGYKAQRIDGAGYIPDYYNAICKVALEVDGSIHKHLKQKDRLKDEHRRKKGIYTLRVSDWRARNLTITVIIEALITQIIWYLYKNLRV